MENKQFLFPYELQSSPTPIKNVLAVGSCLSERYKEHFLRNNESLRVDHILYNMASELPEKFPLDIKEYDVLYIQLSLRSILGDKMVRATNFNNDEFMADLANNAMNLVEMMLENVIKRTLDIGTLTLVSNFIVPQGHIAPSIADFFYEVDLVALVDDLNRRIYEVIRKHSNVFVADIDSIANSIGKQYFLDDMIYMYSHNSAYATEWTNHDNYPNWNDFQQGRLELVPDIGETYGNQVNNFFDSVYRQMESIYRIAMQIDQVKLVIFDLDNTLWRGEIGEHYLPDRKHPAIDTWPTGIWEAVHHLRWRGILVAICSKNSPEIVEERWNSAIQLPWLELNDFVIKKINWKTKAENIREIIDELSLTAKSVVFVDDNPVERAAVKGAFPEIRVIGSNPFETRRILLWAPETQVLRLTQESKKREQMMQNQFVREKAKSSMDRTEFLLSLNSEVIFVEILNTQQKEYARFYELLNKTNQFNTTGKRWSTEELIEFLAHGGRIFSFSAQDKFSEYGFVGSVFMNNQEIVQFVMSCRVLGMDIEVAVIAEIVKLIRNGGNCTIQSSITKTASNMPCRDVFLRSGFVLESEATDEISRFKLNESCDPIANNSVNLKLQQDNE